jgi:uncharacterized protein (DUF169 family)
MTDDWNDLAARLTAVLGLDAPPVAITFGRDHTGNAAPLGAAFPSPTADGRTGAVPAGCVFWMHAVDRAFTTTAADHANCTVGSLTHGFIDLETAATRADVGALVEAGWVTPDAFPSIPVVAETPSVVTYSPLAESRSAPDVVLLRTNGRGLMTLMGAIPDATVEGKPQCRIVALAKEHGAIAASAGCALSRVRTGMDPSDMTCAIPGARLAEVVTALERSATADGIVMEYAASDAARFESRA